MENTATHSPKYYINKAIRYVVPLGVSVGMIVWMFHKVNFHEVMGVIHQGCNLWWIALMMVLTCVSNMIRGSRWGLQLRAAGVPRMTNLCEWVTIWGAYALNLLFPQLGEGWRCLYVSKKEKTPLSTIIGTDIGDRGSDLVVILCLLCLSLIVAHPFIMEFMVKYAVGRDIEKITDDPMLWLGVGGLIAIFWYITRYKSAYKWVKSLDTNLARMWDGFKVIFTMKHRWLYLVLTLAIWVCYFLKTYVCFFAFDFTKSLIYDPHMAFGLIPGLVVFVFGSVSIAIPSNGGLGPWNIAVMFGLTLFGLTSAEGTAFSIVVWSGETIMYILQGLFALAYVIVTGKKKNNA